MSTALAPLATATVLVGAWAGGALVRWYGADRTVARLGLAPTVVRPGPVALDRALHRAAVDLPARTAFHLWLGALAVSVALAATGAGPIAIGVAALGPPIALLAQQGRADRIRNRQLPLALDAMAASLRGGAALQVAVDDAAGAVSHPLAGELRQIASRAARGRPLAEALAEWADEAGDAHSRLAGAALVVAAELGGPGADAIDAAAASLRERAAGEQEVAALSVQARLSALLLTLAPIAFAFLLTAIDPTSARFLFRTPAGWACITGGLLLDLLGGLWMHRLARGAR